MLPWLKGLEEKTRINVGSSESHGAKKNKQKKDVIYPMFLACAEMEDDGPWKKLFEDLAHNILPKGFSVRNRTLAFSNNNKTIPIRLDLEPRVLHDELVEVFVSQKGMSRCDKRAAIAPTEVPAHWKEVKKRSNKKNHVLRYLCSEGRRLGWSEAFVDTQCKILSTWLDCGHVRLINVVLINGDVTKVPDISITEGGMSLERDIKDVKIKALIEQVHVSRMYCSLRNTETHNEAITENEETPSESTTN